MTTLFLLIAYSWFLFILGILSLVPGVPPRIQPLWVGAMILLCGIFGVVVTMGRRGD